MKTLRYVGVLFLLCRASVGLAQDVAPESFLPSDGQVRQIQQSCAIDETGMLALQEKLVAAVADWRKANAHASPGSAMRQLDGYLEQVRAHSNLSGRKSIYVICFEKALRQFVDVQREKPRVLVASGSSQTLQRMSFASEDEIWRRGCKDAETQALTNLRQQCGEREFVETNSDCAQADGDTRVYTAQVGGECRGR